MSTEHDYRILQRSPDNVGFISDSSLATFAPWNLPERQSLAVAAELLFRFRWLYTPPPEPPVDLAALCKGHGEDFFSKLPETRTAHTPSDFKADASDPPLVHLAKARIRSFIEADGIIPVIDRAKNAFPIPFRVQRDPHVANSVCDSQQKPIAAWADAAEHLWKELGGRHRVTISLPLANTLELEGGSFALPIALAIALRRSAQPLQTLTVMATGAVQNGVLSRVEGVEAKAALARKIGACLFIHPALEQPAALEMATLSIAADTPLKEVLENTRHRLEELGLDTLSPKTASELLSKIKAAVAHGECPLDEAVSTVERCVQTLQQTNNPFLQTKIIEAKVLLASIHNHGGRSDEAMAILKTLDGESETGCKVLSNLVVSLSDEGRFDEAVALGRQNLEFAKTLPERSRSDLVLRIEAAGSLGGDALLGAALRRNDPEMIAESRTHLTNVLHWSRQLADLPADKADGDQSNWTARSAARLALWTALFRPHESEQAFAENLQFIPQDDLSMHFLRRMRLLGKYRQLLLDPAQPPAIGDCELPAPGKPHLAWLLSTALKYRGAIRAAQGMQQEAVDDFAYAIRLLQRGTGILGLIRWSAAAQAVCSLSEARAEAFWPLVREERTVAVHYLKQFHPSSALCDSIDKDPTPAHLREFQRGFAY